MSHMMEDKSQEDHMGDPVTYIPNHAKGDVNHSDVEHGTISSFNESCL
jgi:hypothetical protein